MIAFAERTGLGNSAIPPRRYLWTDAHAVCTFLSLYRHTGDEHFKVLAAALIDQVHEVLGRHRGDDPRKGWISGLGEAAGRAHPTAGGLRIGKRFNERRRSEAFDETLEWERDGQYFHYLTKWMHALYRAAAVLEEPRYGRWALELAEAAYAGFAAAAPGGKRLRWKMSIDLSYPLVPSSGQHDPLDGYITFLEISQSVPPGLDAELKELALMMSGRDWTSGDPLGIGGLLFDACRLFQLAAPTQAELPALIPALLGSAQDSLPMFLQRPDLHLQVEHRLAFRELGLAIGLHAVELMIRLVESNNREFPLRITQGLEDLSRYLPIAETIESFWYERRNQASYGWRAHEDINAVTLATSLLPGEFLSV